MAINDQIWIYTLGYRETPQICTNWSLPKNIGTCWKHISRQLVWGAASEVTHFDWQKMAWRSNIAFIEHACAKYRIPIHFSAATCFMAQLSTPPLHSRPTLLTICLLPRGCHPLPLSCFHLYTYVLFSSWTTIFLVVIIAKQIIFIH